MSASQEYRRKIVDVSFSGTRGEGFGKLHITVLLNITQGYSGGKCASVCLVPQYVLCIGGPVD